MGTDALTAEGARALADLYYKKKEAEYAVSFVPFLASMREKIKKAAESGCYSYSAISTGWSSEKDSHLASLRKVLEPEGFHVTIDMDYRYTNCSNSITVSWYGTK